MVNRGRDKDRDNAAFEIDIYLILSVDKQFVNVGMIAAAQPQGKEKKKER
ncbi:MAG: hypothetical protein ACREDR_10430 [Blastocatellia bacterium]